MKMDLTFGNIFISVFIIAFCSLGTARAINPPGDVAHKYSSNINWTISDNFNSFDANKWCYRAAKGGTGNGRKYVSYSNGLVRIKCDVSDKKGGGISALNWCRYGFFITRFKITGIDDGVPSPTHPSIWGSKLNLGEDNKLVPCGADWIELDWIEYHPWGKTPCWNSDCPVRINNVNQKPKRSVMLDDGVKTKFKKWEIIGLEYHPNYVQVWQYTSGSWKRLGRRIPAKNYQSRTTIKRSTMQGMYWILSNKYYYAEGSVAKDSWLNVDYFHYYPLKGTTAGNAQSTSLKGAISDDIQVDSPTGATLYNNYPNPASTNSTFNFEIAKQGFVRLTLLDLSGKEKSILVNEQLEPGTYSKTFNVADLENGVYISKLETNGEVITSKIIVKK